MLVSGTLLNNRFRLKKLLHENPSRQTWLGEDIILKDRVVVKLLALGTAVQWDDFKLLEREAQILQQLNHPHLVKYRDYFSVNDQNPWFGLVTEYIPGISLQEKLAQHYQFSPSKIQWIASEVLEILNYLHHHNPPILHRDIKPSNLIWGEDNQIYLIDFGSVQLQPRTPGSTFTVVGTYGYTPIEQFGGQAVPASDLYGLGATLVHLLTAISPSDLPQENFKLQFQISAGSSISPKFKKWLERLIEPSLNRRFTSAQEALTILKSIPGLEKRQSEPVMRFSQSPQELTIEIPSKFSIQYVQPIQKITLKSVTGIKNVFKWIPGSLPVKGLTIGAIGLFLLLKIPLSPEFLNPQNLEFIAILPLALLVIGVPISVSFLIYRSVTTANFFERVKLNFDEKNYDIWWFFSHRIKHKQGEINQIQKINIIQLPDNKGLYHPTLEIVTQESKLYFFSQRKTYYLGQQLSEEELQVLKQKINQWLKPDT